jgi:hypothetical protein
MSVTLPVAPVVELTGQMTPIPLPNSATSSLGSEGEGYTLNEPVSVTIMRDLRRVGKKLGTVLLPMQAEAETLRELRDWDLWGPLLLCLALSIITSARAPVGQQALVFASVFVLVWAGAAVVTLNGQLLGGKMCAPSRCPAPYAPSSPSRNNAHQLPPPPLCSSFFQSVCVLGYCVCPLVIAAVLGLILTSPVLRIPLVLGAFVWSCRASVVFMKEMVPAARRLLAVYPVCLFYMMVAWMVFMV